MIGFLHPMAVQIIKFEVVVYVLLSVDNGKVISAQLDEVELVRESQCFQASNVVVVKISPFRFLQTVINYCEPVFNEPPRQTDFKILMGGFLYSKWVSAIPIARLDVLEIIFQDGGDALKLHDGRLTMIEELRVSTNFIDMPKQEFVAEIRNMCQYAQALFLLPGRSPVNFINGIL